MAMTINGQASLCRANPKTVLPPLPGTLTLDYAESDNEVTKESLRKEDLVSPKGSLTEQVDDFGWTLVAAIRDFRSHVEDIFADHYQAMKRVEDQHKISLAKLAAENGQLRDRLGLPSSPGLLQNIHFQPVVPVKEKEDKKKIKSQEQQIMSEIHGKAVRNKEVIEDPSMGVPHKPGMAIPMVGGGTWETFVAWVPAGAALECPQPWKPLPNEAFAPVEIKKKEEEFDDEEEGRWKVHESWAAEKEDLEELRKNVEMFKSVIPKSGDALTSGVQPIMVPMATDDPDGMEETVEEQPKRFMIHPHSAGRICWDLGSLCMVVYDMVMIPMSFFDLGDTVFIEAMNWTTRIFWTFDMPMSMVTGVVRPNGTITFDMRFILKRYVKTWFLLDLFIVASDWVEFVMSAGGGSGIGKIARIFRVVRCFRLLRLVKMQAVLKDITERIQSDNLMFALKVFKLAALILAIAHVIACIWWGIGKRSDTGTWAEDWLKNYPAVEDRYLVSMHWTLSQFSGGMDEIKIRGVEERFFVVVFWVIAFMCAAIVGSSLTSSMVQAHIIGGSQARQLATLRKFLNQNSISKNLSLRVQRSAKHAISGDLSPDAVDLLGVVSEQLKLEMHFEMYSELFRCHPFFEQCNVICNQVMRRLCHLGTTTLMLDSGDIVFSKGEAPAEPKMLFVFKGTLEYTPPSGGMVLLSEKQWIAEAVLWLQWTHRGTLKAISDIKVARLDARKFQDIMERFKEVFPIGFSPKVYAHDFAATFNKLPLDQVHDLTATDSSM